MSPVSASPCTGWASHPSPGQGPAKVKAIDRSVMRIMNDRMNRRIYMRIFNRRERWTER